VDWREISRATADLAIQALAIPRVEDRIDHFVAFAREMRLEIHLMPASDHQVACLGRSVEQ